MYSLSSAGVAPWIWWPHTERKKENQKRTNYLKLFISNKLGHTWAQSDAYMNEHINDTVFFPFLARIISFLTSTWLHVFSPISSHPGVLDTASYSIFDSINPIHQCWQLAVVSPCISGDHFQTNKSFGSQICACHLFGTAK